MCISEVKVQYNLRDMEISQMIKLNSNKHKNRHMTIQHHHHNCDIGDEKASEKFSPTPFRFGKRDFVFMASQRPGIAAEWCNVCTGTKGLPFLWSGVNQTNILFSICPNSTVHRLGLKLVAT